MPIFDVKCPKCSNWRDDVLLRSDAPLPTCDLCDTEMEKLPPMVAPAVYTKGRSAESAHAWGTKEKARLEKRSNDYDASPKGKAERETQVDKLRRNGTIPTGWSA